MGTAHRGSKCPWALPTEIPGGESVTYLRQFSIPGLGAREGFTNDIKRRCYNTVYPFNVFELRELPELEFEPVTILCGGNGCGKSTLLNVIAEKLSVTRSAPYNLSNFFDDYVQMCRCEVYGEAYLIFSGKMMKICSEGDMLSLYGG